MSQTGIEKIREHYITEQELAHFLGVDVRRIQDLRSQGKFISRHFRPTSKCRLYAVSDVLGYIDSKSVTKEDNEEK